jgi:hypothetical protein
VRALATVASVLFLTAAGPGDDAMPAPVKRAIGAYGIDTEGPALRSMLVSWRYTLHVGDQEEDGQLFELLSFPDRVRREYRVKRRARNARVSGTDGANGWRVQPVGRSLAVVSAEPGEFTVALRVRAPAWLLSEVASGRARAETVAPDGRRPLPGVERVLVTRDTGEMVALDVDKRGLVLRYEGQTHAGSTGGRVRVELSQWRRDHGVWVPGRIVTHVDDVVVESLELEALEVNRKIAEGFFSDPFPSEPPTRKL